MPIHLPDPVRTWLDNDVMNMWLEIEEGMWPGVAERVSRYSRSVLEETESMTLPELARINRRRAQLESAVGDLFTEIDVLLTPTTAVPAFAAGGPPPTEINGQEVHPAMATPFTMLANLCWNPSISVPAGLTEAGLPVGLLITTRRHRDDHSSPPGADLGTDSPWPCWAR